MKQLTVFYTMQSMFFFYHLAHRLYTSGEYPTSYLILEDMTETSYACENSALGFDFEQSKFILEKLAFWHASTAKLIEDVSITMHNYNSIQCIHSSHYRIRFRSKPSQRIAFVQQIQPLLCTLNKQ